MDLSSSWASSWVVLTTVGGEANIGSRSEAIHVYFCAQNQSIIKLGVRKRFGPEQGLFC
jgi:hypothetical protein